MKNKLGLSAMLFSAIFLSSLCVQAQRDGRDNRRESKKESHVGGDGNHGLPNRNVDRSPKREEVAMRQPNQHQSPTNGPRIATPRNTNPNSRPNDLANRNGYGNSNNTNRYHTPVYRSSYGNNRPYYSPRYTVGAPYFGQRFTSINHAYINIGFGGISYNYYGGSFYRPYGNYYQVVVPPIGIRISMLPTGYHRFLWGNNPYYYYNGIFYNQYNNSGYYQVVDPPLGAKLPDLPAGAKRVFINGASYFENDGTYYAEEYNINNQILYTVVGVHGVLNTEQLSLLQQQNNQLYPNQQPSTGDFIKVLPPNCKPLQINGQKMYVSPQNDYYQETLDSDGSIGYIIVGKSQ